MTKAYSDSHHYNFLYIFNELACKGIAYQLETGYSFSEQNAFLDQKIFQRQRHEYYYVNRKNIKFKFRAVEGVVGRVLELATVGQSGLFTRGYLVVAVLVHLRSWRRLGPSDAWRPVSQRIRVTVRGPNRAQSCNRKWQYILGF